MRNAPKYLLKIFFSLCGVDYDSISYRITCAFQNIHAKAVDVSLDVDTVCVSFELLSVMITTC